MRGHTASVPEVIIRNARIWTGDGATPWATSAAIDDGRFIAVGGPADVEAAPHAGVLDLGGRLLLPGLTDSHTHLLGTGLAMQSVDLKRTASAEDAASRVGQRVRAAPPGAWVRGAGWDQNDWPAAAFPHRRVLDAVAPHHPVVLDHTSGHCIWVNSAAIRAAGVDASTTAPEGGAIDHDHAGEPSGIFRDNAARLITAAVPHLERAERTAAIEAAVAHAHSLGVTCVHAMDVGRGEFQALHALNDSGRLRLRVRTFMSAGLLDEWIDRNLATGDGDDMLRVGGVKFFADGALGSMTAWMLEPFEGTTDCGLALQPAAGLERAVRRCLEQRLAPAIHAIGDRANREVLDILERTREIAPDLPRRIEHAQLLAPGDMPRFAALGVTASVQPIHATQDMAKVDRAWGARGSGAYAFATLLASGATLAFGSDTPVETMDPLAGIHAAATRRRADGTPPAGWYPTERLTVPQAVAAYTTGAAHAIREPALGRIATGAHADFIVLSGDILAMPDPMRILDARVEMTVVGGETVYEKAS
jgi:predicted amidohydrolase YtcJ